ncbi:hypothetical protein CLV30_12572 [Haloactinopolyspora alba]|uniref:Phage Mu protein F like protein n=1 Tax=Haloactinopolyspora alba TaxID=648780 RepID=A0A2P8DHJ8_9ACTN|nr:hypothetical protein [Haloactinopolyspora alba]PSK96690.1 hypothetical protein CLV30_12572 [Haloactinopolyspora alba]
MAIPAPSTDRYRQRQTLSRELVTDGRRAWRQLATADITGSWRAAMPRLMVTLTGAQLAAARGSDEYVSAALAEQGADVDPAGQVVPRSLAGTASDGRPLDTLLDQPRITTLTALSQGATTDRALASGWAELEMILRTEVADAGRVADGVAIASRPNTGWVRMIQGKTCGRCAILAGKWFAYNRGFERHPRCDCVHIPSREATSGDLTTDPRRYFDSLTETEQNRLFGATNAQAIRDGGNVTQVINARRGMYTAGGRRLTREGTTRRGLASQRMREIDPLTGERVRNVGRRGSVANYRERRVTRLMPEQIYDEATSRADAIRLLRLHGYIT